MMETDIMVDTGMKLTAVARSSLPDSGSFREPSRLAARCRSSPACCCAPDGMLELAATDMELSLRTSLDAEIEGEGSVVVPGRLLVDLARLLPDAEVQLEHRADEGVLTVMCGTASYRLHTYNAEDFPRLPEIDDTQIFTGRRRGVARDGRAGVALRFARRVAPGAHRHPGAVRAGQARDGRHRLVPARGQGDRLAGRRRSSKRSSRRARSRSSLALRARRRSSSSACRRTRSRFAPTRRC